MADPIVAGDGPELRVIEETGDPSRQLRGSSPANGVAPLRGGSMSWTTGGQSAIEGASQSTQYPGSQLR